MDTSLVDQLRTVNILLVDDDDGDAKSVQRAFKSARIANPIVRAIDGVDALDILRGTNGKPRLAKPYILLVDVNMPRMNGLELIRALRQDAHLHTSVVFVLTTSSRQDDKLSAYDSNVAGYIVKERAGHDFQKLIDMVQIYWRVVELP